MSDTFGTEVGGMNTFGVRVFPDQHPGFKNPGLLNEPLWGIAMVNRAYEETCNDRNQLVPDTSSIDGRLG